MNARVLDINTPIQATDAAIQKQHKLLEELRAQPYFRSFEPRAYSLYTQRHYDPVGYLEEVGIEKIAEIVQHGYSLQEVCFMMNISTGVMRRWIQRNRAYRIEIDEAQKWSADNLAYKSVRVIEDSSIEPLELNKNKALAESYRWLAERHNKEVYGTKTIKHEGGMGVLVNYNFNISSNQLKQVRDAVDNIPEIEEQEILDIHPELPSLDFSKDND